MRQLLFLLSKPWAIFLAFIPGINIAYIVFRMLVDVDDISHVPVWMYSIIVIPGFILYRFTPDEYGWLITHLVISGFAAIYMYRSRGAYRYKLASKEKLLRNFLPLAICAVLLMLGNPERSTLDEDLVTAQEVKEKTLEALDALVENNSEMWDNLLHPVYGASVKTLARFKTSLEFDGINFDEGYTYTGQYGTHYTPYGVDDGDALCMEAYVYIGGKRCFIKTVWQESNSGSGFIKFSLIEK